MEVLSMDQINSIKDLAYEGYSVAKIAREVASDEKTVRKYLAQQDFSPQPPEKRVMPSKLDPYKSEIGRWLDGDKAVWYKQRHTAQRIHQRLSALHPEYNCSYLLVQRYVKSLRASEASRRANQELVWHPGEAQGDFGEADCLEAGAVMRKRYLTLSFPFSNDSFSQLFSGETAECVCQGLQDMFHYIGGVPPLIIFDNATGVGKRIGDAIHETELFGRFRAHYGFAIRFCNPYSGHEKGNVEAKVGYTRRNLFVPLPLYSNIEQFNRDLLERHTEKAKELHYKKQVPIEELFQMDRRALLPLPTAAFDVCRYQYLKADGYGKVRTDGNHWYSTCPEYGGTEVLVAVRAHTVDILSADKLVVVGHRRLFGRERTDSVDYRTSLAVLMKNTGAWKNSGIRELLGTDLRAVLDAQTREELQKTLRTMNALCDEYSFETAVRALEVALGSHSSNPLTTAAVIAARIVDGGLDALPEPGPDLREYDRLLEREVHP
jgi:transposase